MTKTVETSFFKRLYSHRGNRILENIEMELRCLHSFMTLPHLKKKNRSGIEEECFIGTIENLDHGDYTPISC